MIVENAGFGSAAAAPIARRVFDYLLAGLWPNEADIVATQIGKSVAPMGLPRQASDVSLADLGLPSPPASPVAAASAARAAP